MTDPGNVLRIFEEISRIPRCSGNEEQAARWFERRAAARGWASRRDAAGNLLIRVPASPGRERAPAVVLQAHLDMVCEKTPDSPHDFTRDPLRLVREGDWLRAEGTTLGADNGAGLALAAALAEREALDHPPLELLFTVDEETGLSGAKRLEPGFLTGRLLVNLDSETEGVFTVGCAGGVESRIGLPLERQAEPAGGVRRALVVGGLRGGHSGIDIHRPRANAIRILARLLDEVADLPGAAVFALAGGSRRNAIARDARAEIACRPEDEGPLAQRLAEAAERLRGLYAEETGIFCRLGPPAAPPPGERPLARPFLRRALDLLLALPHGALLPEAGFEGLVHSSANLAVVETAAAGLTVVTSQRSLSREGLAEASSRVRAAAALAGARVSFEAEYPPWTPDPDSALLSRCRRVYSRCFGSEGRVRAIHAGLECAWIGAIYPGMDMVSVGPTTENAHSPSERLHLPSLTRLEAFLAALLADLASA